MLDRHEKERPLARAFGIVQALSSRIPPVRAVAVSGNLYKPHACLHRDHKTEFTVALVSLFRRKDLLFRCQSDRPFIIRRSGQ